jgi:hypothetical protein
MSFKSYTKDMTPILLKQQWTVETLKGTQLPQISLKFLTRGRFGIAFYISYIFL